MFEGTAGEIRNVVLVHGGFVDGSGWEGVHRSLRRQGFNVSVVQNPATSLADDVRATRWVLDGLDGPAILVGHSYGGAVISEAGNAPNVAGLVYIAAFAPDAGESVATLIKDPAPGAPVPPILPPRDGFLLLDPLQVRGLVRRGRRAGPGGVHGRRPGAVGHGRARGRGQSAGLEDPAELVSGDHRGSHDPACRPARDGSGAPAPPSPKWLQATRCMSRSPRRWSVSSSRLPARHTLRWRERETAAESRDLSAAVCLSPAPHKRRLPPSSAGLTSPPATGVPASSLLAASTALPRHLDPGAIQRRAPLSPKESLGPEQCLRYLEQPRVRASPGNESVTEQSASMSGAQLPQGASAAFAQAVMDVDRHGSARQSCRVSRSQPNPTPTQNPEEHGPEKHARPTQPRRQP